MDFIDFLKAWSGCENETVGAYTDLSNEAQFTLGNIGHLKRRNALYGGFHWVFTFDNNYGISIIKHDGSYGHSENLWEIAVLYKDDLCYDTPITDDVIGRLSEEKVLDYARQIRDLPERNQHV